ncbi:MAG: ankyrin repeat domain-containing protein [Comamonas sp.]|uniref:ankyrin repeat domain-containing protein n=1 Tax=Comamonas sp. TaxID=34028 RepID=UPI002FCAC6C7
MKPKKSAFPFLPTALAGDSVQLVINGKALTYKLLPAQPTFNQMARDCIEANYLREAARNGDLHLAKTIAERGSLAALNAPGPASSSALVLAAEHGHAPIVDLLLHARAASIDLCRDATAAMEAAVRKGHPEVVHTLLQAAIDFKVSLESKDLLSYAAYHGHEAVIAKLLQWGLDPNSVDPNGSNPVTIAAARGHVDAVRTLVNAGADPKSTEGQGFSAVTAAARIGSADTLRILVHAGADPNVVDPHGRNALTVAAMNGHTDAVRTLVHAGADPNVCHPSGINALMAAVKSGDAHTVTALIEAAAECQQPLDLDAPLKAGHAVLTFAVQCGHTNVLHALIQAGADLNLQTNYDGTTALMFAVQHGRTDALKVLVQAGADPNIANFAGQTALMIAQEMGNAEMTQVLMKAQADASAAGTHVMDSTDAVHPSCPPTLPSAEAGAEEAEVLLVATMARAGDRPMQAELPGSHAAYCADDHDMLNDQGASAHVPAPGNGADGEAANAAPAIAITGAAEEPPQA